LHSFIDAGYNRSQSEEADRSQASALNYLVLKVTETVAVTVFLIVLVS
jgi:hypothetical protein